mmetsp:Transcript_8921/g.33271  ORF Transcript_8921/g.33271 Transcript_8921/m.33271 type:complete len:252 (-) Transcript_8921:35-790(-)
MPASLTKNVSNSAQLPLAGQGWSSPGREKTPPVPVPAPASSSSSFAPSPFPTETPPTMSSNIASNPMTSAPDETEARPANGSFRPSENGATSWEPSSSSSRNTNSVSPFSSASGTPSSEPPAARRRTPNSSAVEKTRARARRPPPSPLCERTTRIGGCAYRPESADVTTRRAVTVVRWCAPGTPATRRTEFPATDPGKARRPQGLRLARPNIVPGGVPRPATHGPVTELNTEVSVTSPRRKWCMYLKLRVV